MTQIVMTFIYPLLAASSLILAAALLVHYWTVRRAKGLLVIAVYFLANCAAFSILSATTGTNPRASFDVWRPFLVGVRVVMFVVISGAIWQQFGLLATMANYQDERDSVLGSSDNKRIIAFD